MGKNGILKNKAGEQIFPATTADQVVWDKNTNLKQAMAKQDARISNLAKLPSGSTTGDAELQDIRTGEDGTVYDNAGEAVRGQIGQLKESLKDINVETDKTLTEEDKPADAKMTGKKISELSKNIEDEKNKNVVTLISKEDFKVIEDSEEITDKLYSFNSAFYANFINSANNKYLLGIDDNGQFSADFIKEANSKILLSAFKVNGVPEEKNEIYVSLSKQPENDVDVSVQSDENVTITNNSLTFTKENYFIPQLVVVSSDVKTSSIVYFTSHQCNVNLKFEVTGSIRYLFQNGAFADGITITQKNINGFNYSIADNNIKLTGAGGLQLSGVGLKNGDTIIVNYINAVNGTNMEVRIIYDVDNNRYVYKLGNEAYKEIQINGVASLSYTNNTGKTIDKIEIRTLYDKPIINAIKIVEV